MQLFAELTHPALFVQGGVLERDGNDLITSKVLLHYLLETSQRYHILFVCRTRVLWVVSHQLCPFREMCDGLVALVLATGCIPFYCMV